MNARFPPPENRPTALDRVPRLVDVLDEVEWAAVSSAPTPLNSVVDTAFNAPPDAKAPASAGVAETSESGATEIDAILEACVAACRDVVEKEVQRRLLLELDRHARARFEAWLARAWETWGQGDGLPIGEAVHPEDGHLDDAGQAPAVPANSAVNVDSPDWTALRLELLGYLSKRQTP